MVLSMLHTTAIPPRQNTATITRIPPATHTPRRIRGLVDNMATAAAQTLAKWLAIHGFTTVLPHASLCIAGASLILNIQRERAQGAVSRRHKLALGVILLMAHVAVGESVKTCATLPVHEVESRAQKTILDCFLAYPRKRSKQTHGYDSEEAASAPSQLFPAPTTRGKRGDTTLPTEHHLIISIANGSATLESYVTKTALLDLAAINNTDVMVISEPGRKATEQALKWGTHHITPGETSTRAKRRKLGSTNRSKMAYLAYATHGLDGDGEGGVVVLVHEKWKHRIRDVTRDPTGRWLHLTLVTPQGPVTIIGFYGRPGPQGAQNKKKATRGVEQCTNTGAQSTRERQHGAGGRRLQYVVQHGIPQAQNQFLPSPEHNAALSTGQCRADGRLDTATRTQHHIQDMGGT